MGDFATMGRSSAIGNATCHRLAAWLFPNHHTHPLQGMGSTSNIIAERMTSPGLIDFWKKLVEGSSVHVAADLLKRLPLDFIYKFQSKNHIKIQENPETCPAGARRHVCALFGHRPELGDFGLLHPQRCSPLEDALVCPVLRHMAFAKVTSVNSVVFPLGKLYHEWDSLHFKMILGITCIQLGYSSWNIIFVPYLRFKRYAFIWFYLMPEVCGSLRWQVRWRWQFKLAVVINYTCVNTPYSSATI